MTNTPTARTAVWPIGTICLMATCIAVFVVISIGRFPNVLDYTVFFGPDIQPLQYFTSLFIHVNPVPLIVCLIFLLAIGSQIETRLGLGWTTGLFIGLGAGGQAIAQLALLESEQAGISFGAASGICGWAGLLIVWSPLDKIEQVAKFHIPKASVPTWALVLAWILIGGGVYLAMVGPLSLFPQLISLVAGVLTGAVLLKSKVVEGENKDLLTIIKGTAPGGRKERRKERMRTQAQAEKAEQVEQQVAAAQEQLESYLAAGQLAAAVALLAKMADVNGGLTISSTQLTSIIRGLHKQKKWEDSIPWLQQYVERFPEDIGMRLKLAHIFIVDQRLPGSGMEVLKPLLEMQLPEAEEKLLRQLERYAGSMWEDDDIELEIEKRVR